MANSIYQRNPYIIGRPIEEPNLLFGRQDLFCFLEDNLSHGIKFTLLHGQRRIGKTSIIRNISKLVKLEDFIFIPFNLEYYACEKLSKILAELCQEIITYLQLDTEKIKPLSIQDLETEPYIFSSQFLTKLYDALDNKNIVFLIDESEVLLDEYSNSHLEDFFTYLQSIIEVEDKLFLIMFVGRQSVNLPILPNSFGNATREIGFLDKDSATQLITQPAQGTLEYEPEAIQAIIELSAGHPYFIQVICFALFVRARELDKWQINLQDVDNIVDKAIENAEAGLAWFWDGLTTPEKVVFSAVAESQKIATEKTQTITKNPLKLLKKYGVVETEPLKKVIQELVNYNFLHGTGDKIEIELVRRWLLQRHPLRQETQELKKLQETEHQIYETIEELSIQKNKDNITNNTTSSQNFSNSSSVPTLHEEHLEPEDYKAALKLSDRAEHVHEEIFFQNSEEYVLGKSSKRLNKRLNIGIVVGAMGIAAVVGVGISHLSTPCLARENKILGVFCVEDPSVNVSSGDRTFFPIIKNTKRDQGIQSFKRGNYSSAVELFAQAVDDNRTDPEVLIYYNNARADEKGNPFTLAVVVPAQNNPNIAKEILRGVAQVQQEFNNRDDSNDRLLSITIVNNGNSKEPKVEEVAAQLSKNESISAVIKFNYNQAMEVNLADSEKNTAQATKYVQKAKELWKTDVSWRTVTSYEVTKAIVQTLPANYNRPKIVEVQI